jgi:cell division topological specificity factor
MGFLDYFRATRRNKTGSAHQAKERLQIIVAREGGRRHTPDFIPKMKRELLEVVRKYVKVEQDQVNVKVEREGDYEVLELNITLPESDENGAAPHAG